MITINTRDPRPIYLQIKEGLCRLILTGALSEGERMPSVRELAGQLAINPNTIQRAYEALESEGYICSVPGKGSFAASHTGVDRGRRDELLLVFDRTAAELLFLGVNGETLWARIRGLEGGEVQ